MDVFIVPLLASSTITHTGDGNYSIEYQDALMIKFVCMMRMPETRAQRILVDELRTKGYLPHLNPSSSKITFIPTAGIPTGEPKILDLTPRCPAADTAEVWHRGNGHYTARFDRVLVEEAVRKAKQDPLHLDAVLQTFTNECDIRGQFREVNMETGHRNVRFELRESLSGVQPSYDEPRFKSPHYERLLDGAKFEMGKWGKYVVHFPPKQLKDAVSKTKVPIDYLKTVLTEELAARCGFPEPFTVHIESPSSPESVRSAVEALIREHNATGSQSRTIIKKKPKDVLRKWFSGLSTSGPSTSGPSTSGPSTSGPSNSGPSTSEPLTSGSSASGPSTSGPSTSGSSTSGSSTSGSSTSGPSTSGPSTSGRSTSGSSTSGPLTSGPSTSGPSTSGSSTSGSSTSKPSTSGPSTSESSTSGPSTSGPSTSGPSASGPSTSGPSTLGHSTPGTTTSSPTTSGPSTSVGHQRDPPVANESSQDDENLDESETRRMIRVLRITYGLPPSLRRTVMERRELLRKNPELRIMKSQVSDVLVSSDVTGPSASGPSTTEPLTSGLSTSGPSTSGPSTSGPSTSGPSTSGPSTSGPSTSGPSTSGPSTSGPSTSEPTTSESSTCGPSTSGSLTSRPSTSGPSTAGPSTCGPSARGASTSGPSTSGSSTSGPSTSGPSTSGPSTSGPSTSGPSTSGPSTSGPSTSGPSTSGPSTSGPSTSGPSTSGPLSSADLLASIEKSMKDLREEMNQTHFEAQELKKQIEKRTKNKAYEKEINKLRKRMKETVADDEKMAKELEKLEKVYKRLTLDLATLNRKKRS